MKLFGKKYLVKKLPRHYESIDYLPVLNWVRINETGDLSLLLINPVRLSRRQTNELAKVWQRLFDEYISVFDWNDYVKELAEQRRKIALLQLKRIISKDDNIESFVDLARLRLQALEKHSGESDVYKITAMLEKILGIRIPLGDTSVRKFYTYLNLKQIRENG